MVWLGVGGPRAVVDTLTSLHADAQMNAFIFWPTGDRERQSRLFAEEVVPAVRRAIGSPAPRS